MRLLERLLCGALVKAPLLQSQKVTIDLISLKRRRKIVDGCSAPGSNATRLVHPYEDATLAITNLSKSKPPFGGNFK